MGSSMFRIFTGLASLLLILSGCQDFFVRDLTGDTVVLSSPANGTQTVALSHQFTWEEIKGAEYYNLEIVTPDFGAIQSYVLDTTISSTRFSQTLFPGTYQWRVKAGNFGGETQFSQPFTLIIDTSSDLSNQVVVLNSPFSGFVTNDSTPSFSWQTIFIADSYVFTLKSGTVWNSGIVIYSDTLLATSMALPAINALPEGKYTWGVKAMNAISSSSYTIRNLHIDRTDPPAVSLQSPSNFSLLSTGILNFNWNRPADVGTQPSNRADSVYVYSDTTLTNLFSRSGTSTTSIALTLTNPGWYRWYVISFDQAGNASDTSQKFKFQLN